jgi:hypothetical protein
MNRPEFVKIIEGKHTMELRLRVPKSMEESTLNYKGSYSISSENEGWNKRKIWYFTFDQCPEYLKDNEYIQKGYRAYYSYKESWLSLFDFHNQTVNSY